MRKYLFLISSVLIVLLSVFTSNGQCPPTLTLVPQGANVEITGNNTIGFTVSLCPGQAAEMIASPGSGVSFNWYQNGIHVTDSTFNHYWAKDIGTYYLIISGCATPSATVTVSHKLQPVFTITPSIIPPHICAQQTISMTVNANPPGSPWLWMSPPSLFGTNTNPTGDVTLTSQTVFTLVGTHPSSGCPSTQSVTVLVDDIIDGGTIAVDQQICSGTIPALLTSTSLPTGGGGPGTYTYTWSYSTTGPLGPWTGIPSTNTINYQPGALYQTTWFIRGAASPPCFAGGSNAVQIIVDPIPVMSSGTAMDICTGSGVNYTPASNVPGSTYNWTASVTSPGINVSGFSASGSGMITDHLSLDPGGTTPGQVTYVITPTGPSPTFCPGNPISLIVNVNPIPAVTNTELSQTICSGGTTTLVHLTSGVSGTTFSWYATAPAGISGFITPGTGDIPAQTISSTLTNPAYVTYHITPYGPAPTICPGIEISYTILVNPSPTVTNNPMYQHVCSEQPTAEVILTSNVSGTDFTWTVTEVIPPSMTGVITSGTSSIPVQSITNPGSTIGSVTYHITPSGSLGSCPATPQDYIIYVHPKPAISSSLSENVCSNSPFSYTITSNVSGSSFSWSRASVPGIFNPPASGSGFTINETLINLLTTPVDVTYVLTPTGPLPTSCTGIQANLIVTVKPLPAVSAGLDKTINCGTSTIIDGSATAGTGSITSIAWTPASQIEGPSNILTPTTKNLNSSQTYTLTVTDAGGCQQSDVVQVNVTGTCLAVSPSASPQTICIGQTTHLNANASGGSGSYTYSWSSNPAGFSSTSPTPDAIPVVTTIYTVSVDDGFTTTNGSVTVTVNALPTAYQVTGGGEYCIGDIGVPIGLNNSQTGVNYQLYRGITPVGSPLAGGGSSISFGNFTTVGTYSVRGVNGSTSCQNDMTGSVTVSSNPNPTVNAGPDKSIAYGTSTSLNGVVSSGTPPYIYLWTPISSIVAGQSGLISPLTTNLYTNTEFTLTVNDQKGCTNSDNVWVFLNGDPLSIFATALPDVICNNGALVQLNVVASGGSGDYTYSWTSNPPGWTSSIPNPVVNPTNNTDYIIEVSDGYNTTSTTVAVTVNPLPIIYNVTGGGSYCAGGSGVEIGLSNSQSNINYQLFRGGLPYGPPVPGSGSAISFGFHTAAYTYTVQATNTVTNCENYMNGSAEVIILPLPTLYTVTGGGSYPAGGVGVPIGLSGSQTGINYRLRLGSDYITPPPGIPGTDHPITFGNQTLAGTYVVEGVNSATLCQVEMQGSATVVINPLPTVFNVTGGGQRCSGDPGLEIGLDGSEIGVRYDLLLEGTVIDNLNGTGAELSFGPIEIPGLYTINGVNILTGVDQMMNGNALITEFPLPVIYSMVPLGNACPGVEIYLNGSQSGIDYELRRESTLIMVIPGTGIPGLLSFGQHFIPGTYTITGINTTTGCQALMNGMTVIHPAPAIYTVNPPGIICPGTPITLSSSETGILYQLRLNDVINIGSPLTGTGGLLDFGPQTLPGTYRVIAFNTLNNCYSWMNGSATIEVLPIVYTIIPNKDTCTGAIVRLNGSEIGITYRLIYNGSVILNTLTGTGLPLVFGTYYTSGTYTITAVVPSTLCESQMEGQLRIFDSPSLFNITPNGISCSGSAIGLDDSEIGVNYTLFRDSWVIAAGPIAGTGDAISFGPQNYPGEYTIEAVYASTTCSRTMNGSTTLSPRPVIYNLQPQGPQCAGTEIALNGSETGVVYSLLRNGIVVQTMAGTGSILHFGPQYISGTYTIRAVILLSTCDADMDGNVLLQPLPTAFDITPAGANCAPTIIGLSGSEIGMTYQLIKDGSPSGTALLGTGTSLTFGPQSEGNYVIQATNISTNCLNTMNGQVNISPGPVVNTVANLTICASYAIPLQAEAFNYSAVLWTKTGDGVFSDETILNPIYTPGPGDLLAGTVTLTVTVNGSPACAYLMASASTHVIFQSRPVSDAGPDANICASGTYPLNGTAQYQSSVSWSSNGDGSFDHDNILNPVYTPGGNDILTGTVNLTLSATGITPCQTEVTNDFMVLTLNPLPLVDAGTDATVCENLSYHAMGSITHATAATWSSSGDGTFDNAGSLTPFYTPGVLDIQNGSVILTLAADGLAGCTSVHVTDNMMLYIDKLPVIQAGMNASICENQLFNLNGQAQNYSSFDWTSSGDGTFSTPLSLSGTYTPGPVDLSNGNATLTLTAYGQNSCLLQSVSDQMLLSFEPMPLANAGNDILSCPFLAILLNGSASHFSSVLWTTNGNGTFDHDNILNPLYTPGPADISAGYVILSLTVNGQAECISQLSTDDVRIDFITPPSASISGPSAICNGDPVVLSFSLTGTPPWSLTYSDGSQNYTANNIPVSPYTATVYPIITTTYTLIQVNDVNCNGNFGTSAVTVSVLPNPTEYNLTVTNNGGYCEGGSGVSIGLESSQTGVIYQLLFEGHPSGLPLPGTGGPLDFGMKTAPGTYTVLATRPSTSCQTIFQNSVQVFIYLSPVVDFTSDAACLGTLTQFHLQGPDIANVAQWIWDFGEGTVVTYNSPVEPSHLYPVAGSFQVVLIANDIHGCQKTLTHQVVVGHLPTALFSNSAPVCLGDRITFTDHSYSPSTTYLTQWHWEFGDGEEVIINFPENPNVQHQYSIPGIYEVKLTVTNNQQCNAVKIRLITISPSPVANFDYGNPCANELLSFTDLSQPNGGGSIVEWHWNFGDPNSGVDNVSTLQNPSHLYLQPGDYIVRLIVMTANGCDSTAIKTITVGSRPQSAFSSDTVCLGNPTHFTDLSVANNGIITGWDWNFGDGSAHSFIQNPEHTYATSGNHTVTLTVTNSGSCRHSVSQQVMVSLPPVAGFSNSTINCSASPVSFTDLSFAQHGYLVKWVWNFDDGNTQTIHFPDPQNTTHTYANPGNYNVMLSVQTSDSCWASSAHLVTVGASPLANFESSGQSCNGSQVQFNDLSQPNGGTQIVAWNWNFGDPTSGVNNTSSLTNPTHVYQAAGTYTVQLIITNVSNCSDTMIKTISVNGRPSVVFLADTVCQGSTTHFTDQSVPNSGNLVSWLWNFGDGITSTDQNPTHTYAQAGIYNVSLSVTNSFNCQHDTMQQALVNVTPQSMFGFSGSCSGAEIQFQDLSITSAGSIYLWHWDFGDGDTSNLQNPIHIYTLPGTYLVSLTITNTLGCTDEFSAPVVTYNHPTADYSYFSTYCPAGRVTFTDHSIPSGVPVISWLWYFENGVYSTYANPTHTFSVTDTTYPVKLIVTDANGCTDTIIQDVYVNPGFNFTFQAPPVCIGTPTKFHPQNLAPGDTLHDLRWNFGEPNSGTYNTSSLYSPVHTYSNPGTYIVKMLAYNINNCYDSIYKEVIVYPGPIADFIFDTVPYCDTTAIFYNRSVGSGANVDTLIWKFGDGTSFTEVPPFMSSITHPYNGFGSYMVSLTAVNANGCQHTISKEILVSCIAAGFSKTDTLVCSRLSLSLHDNSGPVSLINNWQWIFGDGKDTTYTHFTPFIRHVYESPGSFDITQVVSSTNNGIIIRDTFRLSVQVFASPIAIFEAFPVCFGDTTRFINLSDSNGVSITRTFWKFGEVPPIAGDTSLLINPDYFYTSAGDHNVKLILTNISGCTDTLKQRVRVNRLPVADFSHSDACSRDHVFFTDKTLPGDTLIGLWSWAFGDPFYQKDTSRIQNPLHNYALGGQYKVFLKAVDMSGCSDTVSKTLTVLESPVSSFTLEENFDGMLGKVRMKNLSENAISYSWDFGNGSHSTQENPIVTYAQDGSYIISLVSWAANNCSDTTIYDYEFMFHNLFVPNAFSPTNIIYKVRLFKPVGINLKQYHIQVFDLSGHLMWESTALDDKGRPLEGWDGTYNGELMPQGNYMWKINATFKDGKSWEGTSIGKGSASTMGNVTLIR